MIVKIEPNILYLRHFIQYNYKNTSVQLLMLSCHLVVKHGNYI